MVMNQFVTTHRKDFLWPYVKTIGLKPQPQSLYQTPQACSCHHNPQKITAERKVFGPAALSEEAWSRLGPMGPLLDPKMYPAKVAAAPESETSRYNQPNVFLQKLYEKYPYIYECIRDAPPEDLLSRINKDRLRTTYQVDFCKMKEYPSAPYDELIRAAGVEGVSKEPKSARLPGDPYRPLQKTGITNRIPGLRKCTGATSKNAEELKRCVGTCSGPLASVTSGATEYQDAISRLGNIIIRDKMHC